MPGLDKILFISCLYPDGLRESLIANSRNGIQFAADKLQWNIVKGLDQHHHHPVQIVNAPAIGSYPLLHRKLFIDRIEFSHAKGSADISAGYCNLAILKNTFIRRSLQNELNKFSNGSADDMMLIVYGLLPSQLLAAIKFKEKSPGARICAIVPDLPEYMNNSGNPIFIARDRLKTDVYSLLDRIDGFVFLTDKMASHERIPDKPWIRIEGMVNPLEFAGYNPVRNDDEFVILYTGTLARRYGIPELLEAFEMIDDDSYKLWIYGEGEARKLIINKSRVNKNIRYLGVVRSEQMRQIQQNATVLVNPRIPADDYTRYSFPSKTMEYYLSGTPVIMYRLSGIPEEYYPYAYCVDKPDVQNLSDKIVEVCSYPREVRDAKGSAAREFVLKEKNYTVQTKKIYEFLARIGK